VLYNNLFLDIQVKEPTPESITKKVKQYLPPRFMSVAQACGQLLNITESDKNNGNLHSAILFSRYLMKLFFSHGQGKFSYWTCPGWV
jgi:diphthamide biosynthesis methyltransferase